MITTCKGCKSQFKVDFDKLGQDSVKFKCKSCDEIITAHRPAPASFESDPTPFSDSDLDALDDIGTDADGSEPGFDDQTADSQLEEKLEIKGTSIRTKITLIIVALVAFSLAIAGIFASYQSREALSKQAEEHLVKNARLKSNEYALSFERIKQEVLGVADYAGKVYQRNDITSDLGIKALMPWDGSKYGNPQLAIALREDILAIQRIGTVLKSIVSNNPYLSLGYFGTESKITVFDNEDVIGVIEKLEAFDVTQRPWYISAKKENKVIWTEPYVDANTKKLVVTCAVPVYRENDILVGVVGFDVLLDTIQKDILTMDIGYDSYAFLVNSKGKILVRPGMETGDSRWDSTYETEDLLKTDNMKFNQIVQKMINGETGIDNYESSEGVRYTTYAPLEAIGASMGIVASRDEVIKPAIKIQNIIIAIFVTVLLLSIIIGLVIGSNITKPINELTTRANLISQGELDLDVLKEDRKDEIGVLTESFNRLVVSLKLAMKR